jgi:hypothetical protein
MAWWQDNRLRLIQNNLREIDADLDADRLVKQLQDFGANTWMMNAGGIFAYYPTSLEDHYVTPYLRKDLLGEAVEAAHRAGMRFIARFDFSKAHESIYRRHPDWFYRTREGEAVNYHGIVHTCLNGYYQQEYSLLIIEEVLKRYPVDGIFFNMFGYQTKDYSGVEYGICHCGNCGARFREMYGLELPEKADANDPRYRAYKEFQERTSRLILERIAAHAKSINPEIAICTYHHHQVDIIRKESNTALTRPHPVWQYTTADNVMSTEHSWPEKLVSNCSINAIDLPYRFTGVSPHETEIRLYTSIAAGSGLDFCIIGVFDGYPDRTNFEAVKRAFQFHRDHETLFGSLGSMADLVLLRPDAFNRSAEQEYRGLFKMLKERHVPFDVVEQAALPDHPAALDHVQLVVLPGIQTMTEETLALLERKQRTGTKLVATGCALRSEPEALRRLFGVAIEEAVANTHAAYVAIDDRERFAGQPDKDWVVVDGRFDRVAAADGERHVCLLPFVEPALFGPPERSFGHSSGRSFGCFVRQGQAVIADGKPEDTELGAYWPWEPGKLYYNQGFADYRELVVGLLDHMAECFSLATTAPPSVELYANRLPSGGLMVQFINLSGFNGVTYHEPLPIHSIRVRLKNVGEADWAGAIALKSNRAIPLIVDADGSISFTLAALAAYEAVHLYERKDA